MKITAIRDATVSDPTRTRNASIGFASMTASALVVETDRAHDGAPLRGLAFDSVGRYAHGALLRERFIPRLLAAHPDDYLDASGHNIDPAKVWAILMRDEKPGGHGERAGAVGLLDAAIWDLVAKVAGRPLWAELRHRFGGATSEQFNGGFTSVGYEFTTSAPLSISALGIYDHAGTDISAAGWPLICESETWRARRFR